MGKESKVLLIKDILLEDTEMMNYISSNPDIQLEAVTNNIFICSMKDVNLNEPKSSAPSISAQVIKTPEELMDVRSAKFDEIGMKPSLIGRRYLLDALELIDGGADHKQLCKIIASKYEKSQESVRCAMNRAIQTTWDSMPDDVLQENYTARLRPNKTAPTVMEFLHYFLFRLSA